MRAARKALRERVRQRRGEKAGVLIRVTNSIGPGWLNPETPEENETAGLVAW